MPHRSSTPHVRGLGGTMKERVIFQSRRDSSPPLTTALSHRQECRHFTGSTRTHPPVSSHIHHIFWVTMAQSSFRHTQFINAQSCQLHMNITSYLTSTSLLPLVHLDVGIVPPSDRDGLVDYCQRTLDTLCDVGDCKNCLRTRSSFASSNVPI